MDEKKIFFTVRLTPQEAATLDRLAKDTDRSRGAVMRRLLWAAANDPQAVRVLGLRADKQTIGATL